MAGWELEFDVALKDVDLASDCFRILRRTRASDCLQFTYYEERRNHSRVNCVLAFDGRPPQLGLASADFALEMRADSMLPRHPRATPATPPAAAMGHVLRLGGTAPTSAAL